MQACKGCKIGGLQGEPLATKTAGGKACMQVLLELHGLVSPEDTMHNKIDRVSGIQALYARLHVCALPDLVVAAIGQHVDTGLRVQLHGLARLPAQRTLYGPALRLVPWL